MGLVRYLRTLQKQAEEEGGSPFTSLLMEFPDCILCLRCQDATIMWGHSLRFDFSTFPNEQDIYTIFPRNGLYWYDIVNKKALKSNFH